MNRRLSWRSQPLKDEKNFVLLDQLTGLFLCFWRAVAVIERNKFDLATIDAAILLVDLVEIGVD